MEFSLPADDGPEWDGNVGVGMADMDCRRPLSVAASRDARHVVVVGGPLFLCIERCRQALYDALDIFLEPA
jgi:hypothetical protein